MRVSELAALIAGSRTSGPDREIFSLKANSADIGPGDAFIALKGSITDGHTFIDNAVKAGAGVIIRNHAERALPSGTAVMQVPDTKAALKVILPALFPHARNISLVGITGTNGKTTTTYLLESVLKAAGMNPAVLGTINMRYAGISIPSAVTTPGPIELFGQLENMNSAGVDACIMEVSSHALDQDRLTGLCYDYAAFTNLSQDHLDYHTDMDTYFLAKKKLFEDYLSGVSVINIDDPYGAKLAAGRKETITYGVTPQAMVHVSSLEHTPAGLLLDLSTPEGPVSIKSSLLGDINAYNIMAAVALSQAMGIQSQAVVSGIAALGNVPGRMELVHNPRGLRIIVDYAHTPAALETALSSARGFTSGRLITVFGCGGDRDRTKRPVMGRIASQIADMAIVTSDNPRTENPAAIIDDILAGISNSARIMVEPDRKEAIRLGVSSMNPEDCLVIAGKGHEDYQIIGKEKRPFDDREHVLKSLEELYR